MIKSLELLKHKKASKLLFFTDINGKKFSLSGLRYNYKSVQNILEVFFFLFRLVCSSFQKLFTWNTLTYPPPFLMRRQKKVVHSHSPAFQRNAFAHSQFTTEPDTWHEIIYGILNLVLLIHISAFFMALNLCWRSKECSNISWQICNLLHSADKGNVFPSSSKREKVQVPETGLITVLKHTAAMWFIWKHIGQLAHPLPLSDCHSQQREYFYFLHLSPDKTLWGCRAACCCSECRWRNL